VKEWGPTPGACDSNPQAAMTSVTPWPPVLIAGCDEWQLS